MIHFSKDITFVVFTYNEEKRIERVIKNLSPFGKVLLADNQSTDNTVAIAKKFNCDVYTRQIPCTYVETDAMMKALQSVITTPWMYWGFADEMLEMKTLVKINEIIATGRYDVISIDRKNYFWGKFCYNAYSSRTNKIFKVGAIDFTNNKIHGFGKLSSPDVKVFDLPDEFFVHHFISNTIESYLNTINRYTNVEASQASDGKQGIIRVFRCIVSGFGRHYFLRGGYKAGIAGLALVAVQVLYSIVKLFKIAEVENGLSMQEIEMKNNQFRNNILSEMSNHFKE